MRLTSSDNYIGSQLRFSVLFKLVVPLVNFLFVVFQRIERVKKWLHRLSEKFSFTDVNFNKEREWHVVKNVLSQTIQRVFRQILEQLRFFGQMSVTLKVVY